MVFAIVVSILGGGVVGYFIREYQANLEAEAKTAVGELLASAKVVNTDVTAEIKKL